MPLGIKNYIKKNSEFKAESYWIELFKLKEESTNLISRFFINLMIIPHSNAEVERIFSCVKLTKSYTRNRLGISTLDNLMQVKHVYNKEEKFEPTEVHYNLYRMHIKSD